MKLSAPTQGMFFASLTLAVLGLLGFMGAVPQLAGYSFWLIAIGYALLLVGNLAKGL